MSKRIVCALLFVFLSVGTFAHAAPPGELLLEISQIRTRLSQYEKAHEALWDAARLAKQNHRYKIEARSLFYLAQVHAKWQSPKAQKKVVAPFLDMARALSARTGDIKMEGVILSAYPELIADQTKIKAALSQALDCYLSLRNFDGVENASEKADATRHGLLFDAAADILDAIAMYQLAAKRGDFKKAQTLLDQAINQANHEAWARTQARLWTLKGDLATRTGDIEAQTHYQDALAIYTKRGNLKGQAETQFAMGQILAKAGYKAKALPLVKSALVAAKNVRALKLLAQIQVVLGR